MPELIKRIRTDMGDAQIDYESLANLPLPDATLTKSGAFADAAAVGVRINSIKDTDLKNIKESISELKTVEVRNNQPTASNTEVWINPGSKDSITIPEIKDSTTNTTDTWSSSKISAEVAKASKSANADVSSVATMKASVENTVTDFNTTASNVNKALTDIGNIQKASVTKAGTDAVASINSTKDKAITDINNSKSSVVSAVTTEGNTQKSAITAEGKKQVSAVTAASTEIQKINGVEITKSTPTNSKTAIWIDPSTKQSMNLPEINDLATNTTDTWSSKKISDEIAALKAQIAALQKLVNK